MHRILQSNGKINGVISHKNSQAVNLIRINKTIYIIRERFGKLQDGQWLSRNNQD